MLSTTTLTLFDLRVLDVVFIVRDVQFCTGRKSCRIEVIYLPSTKTFVSTHEELIEHIIRSE